MSRQMTAIGRRESWSWGTCTSYPGFRRRVTALLRQMSIRKTLLRLAADTDMESPGVKPFADAWQKFEALRTRAKGNMRGCDSLLTDYTYTAVVQFCNLHGEPLDEPKARELLGR